MLLKKEENTNNSLLGHLKKINDHLANRGTRFLTGGKSFKNKILEWTFKKKNEIPDQMCCFDCELMPRLQHIRVAGKYFAEFEIPNSFEALWRYMYHMYQLDAFTQSCPADQDIINHYKLQQGKGDVKQMKINKHE